MSIAAVRVGARPSRRVWRIESLSFQDFLVLTALHALLALVVARNPWIATAYGVLVVGGSLRVAWNRPSLMPLVMGYVITAELLWRVGAAFLPWELGKYACCALFLFSLRTQRRALPLAAGVTILALLLPSVGLTVAELGFSQLLRSTLAMSLSGPLTLALGIAALGSLKASAARVHQALMLAALPVVTLATLTLVHLYAIPELVFDNESNFQTSAGYGPNQVSSVLGAGSLALVLVSSLPLTILRRNLLFALSTWFLAQAIFTFSRGGVLTAGLAIVALTIHHLGRAQRALPVLAVFVLFAAITTFVVAPRMNSYTQGALLERFTSVEAGLRGKLSAHELSLFRENPILGVGPGMAPVLRRRSSNDSFGATSHSEYSRALGEHGVLGGLYLAIAGGMAARSYFKASGLLAKGWVAALAIWGFSSMAETGMRLAVMPVFLACCYLDFSNDPVKSSAPEPHRQLIAAP